MDIACFATLVLLELPRAYIKNLFAHHNGAFINVFNPTGTCEEDCQGKKFSFFK